MITNEQIEMLATTSAEAGDLCMAAIAYRALEWEHSLASTELDAAERAKVEAMPVSTARAACERAVQESAVREVVEAAIEESTSTNGIARIHAGSAERAGVVELDDVRLALCVECDGEAAGNGEQEYWGTTVDGDEWRVHVVA